MNIVNLCLERGAPFRDGIIMLTEKLIDNELMAPNENEIRRDLLRARKIGGLSIVEAGKGDLVTAYPLGSKGRLIHKRTWRREKELQLDTESIIQPKIFSFIPETTSLSWSGEGVLASVGKQIFLIYLIFRLPSCFDKTLNQYICKG